MSKQKKIVVPTEEEIELFGNKIKIVKTNLIRKGEIFMIDSPKLVGSMSARTEIEVIPADPIKNLSLGWTVHETVGIGVINSRGINGVWINDKAWTDAVKDIINKKDD